jgi:hypothetical protein
MTYPRYSSGLKLKPAWTGFLLFLILNPHSIPLFSHRLEAWGYEKETLSSEFSIYQLRNSNKKPPEGVEEEGRVKSNTQRIYSNPNRMIQMTSTKCQ